MGFEMLMRWEKYEKSTSTQIPQDCDQNLENLTVKWKKYLTRVCCQSTKQIKQLPEHQLCHKIGPCLGAFSDV